MRIKLFIQLKRDKVLSDLILKVNLGFLCRIEISHPLDACHVPLVVENALYNGRASQVPGGGGGGGGGGGSTALPSISV